MNYAKGKWEAYESPFAPAVIINRPRRLIATCHLELGSEGMTDATANAQLIAAAVNGCISVNPDNPQAVGEAIKDMYEALRRITGELEMICDNNVDDYGWGKDNEYVIVAKQALAKAEEGKPK